MKKALVIFGLFLVGCQSHSIPENRSQTLAVDHHYRAISYQPRIHQIVIHYTVADESRALRLLTGKQVSSHYLIAEYAPKGGQVPTLYQLVPEDQAAWHAGISAWRGTTNLNETSIGIELVNQGYTQVLGITRCQPYPPAQIKLLSQLLRQIVARYQIAPENIVGHSDIAPQRKSDPSACFPWQQLAKEGLGAWPQPNRVAHFLQQRATLSAISNQELLPLLRRYGYFIAPKATPEQQRKVIKAFQMHFQPENSSGYADRTTLARLQALLEQYPQ